MYVPSLVTWWRLYALSFSSRRVTSLSFSLSFFPQISCITFAGNTYGIKPRVLSTSLSYSFFFRLIPVSSFFFVSSPPRLLSKEQRDIQKMSTKSESTLLLNFHLVDRSFAHNGYRVTRSCMELRFSFLRNPRRVMIDPHKRSPPLYLPLVDYEFGH